jgi:alpha/beta superfamily hydrolase
MIAQWRRRGIVMAHPYAPMGGSYDDRVVGIVVEEFLRAGWIVGTFNFRYVHVNTTLW